MRWDSDMDHSIWHELGRMKASQVSANLVLLAAIWLVQTLEELVVAVVHMQELRTMQ